MTMQSKSQFRVAVCWTLLLAIVSTSFMNDADARRHRRRVKRKRAPIINEKKLYERIGGTKTVGEISDEWVRMNLADSRVSALFTPAAAKPEKLSKWRRGLSDQICEWTDGPCKANVDGELKKAEVTMAIDETQFLAFSDNLFRAMQKYNVPEREKNQLLGRLGDYRADVLPDDD
jgi:truncated hemoglobin YjbI